MSTPGDCSINDGPLNALTDRCVRCGFCNATCPTYLETGHELEGPRGRIQLIRAAFDDQPVTRKTQQHLDHCLTCLSCETTCPSGVRYREIIDRGRALLETRVKRPLLARWARRGLARLVGWPRVLGAGFLCGRRVRSLMPERLQPYLAAPRRSETAEPKAGSESRGRAILLVEGCIQRALAPAFDAALAEILRALGYAVEGVPGATCCGAVAQHLGEPRLAERQRRPLINALLTRQTPCDRYPVEAVMMSSSGCGRALREALADPRLSFPRVVDPLEFLEAHREALRGLLHNRPHAMTPWVIHEPCSLQHGGVGGIRLTRFLSDLGFEVMEDPERSLCCGAGGTHALFHPELAGSLRTRKRRALGVDEGRRVLSSNIGCILHLGDTAELDHWLCGLARALRPLKEGPG